MPLAPTENGIAGNDPSGFEIVPEQARFALIITVLSTQLPELYLYPFSM